MKLSPSYTLFGIFAFASGAFSPPTSALASAAPVPADAEKTTAASDDASLPVSRRLLDSTVNRITLQGIDLGSEPLSEAESAYLEETIAEVVDMIYAAKGVDLYAESVTLAGNWRPSNKTDTDETEPVRNLRGLYIRDKPHVTNKPPRDDDDDWYDRLGDDIWNYDCDWNVVVRCSWMCGLDDDDVPVYPTRAPVRNWLVHQFGDDDWKGPKPDINRRFTLVPTASSTESPSMVPTEKVVLEEERGPEEPSFDLEVLKKFRKSPWTRFRRIKKVRYGWH